MVKSNWSIFLSSTSTTFGEKRNIEIRGSSFVLPRSMRTSILSRDIHQRPIPCPQLFRGPPVFYSSNSCHLTQSTSSFLPEWRWEGNPIWGPVTCIGFPPSAFRHASSHFRIEVLAEHCFSGLLTFLSTICLHYKLLRTAWISSSVSNPAWRHEAWGQDGGTSKGRGRTPPLMCKWFDRNGFVG